MSTGQRARVVGVRERLADRDLGQPGHGDDLARSGLGRVDPVEAFGDVQLGNLEALDRAVRPAPRRLLSPAYRAVEHPADGEAADIGRRVEVRDERLQRMVGLEGRGRDVLGDDPEQRLQVVPLDARVERGVPGPGVAVDDRELDLLLVGVEVQEELVDLVDDLFRTGVGPVDLVDDEHDRQAALECLAQHEASLRQRALARVDEEEDAVDHRERSLDLPAEVRVARRVDDVELHAPVADGGVLGEDRDALFSLEVHRVHDPLVDLLIGPEDAGLPQHPVDERGLAVVDVGDDGEVAEVGARKHVVGTPERARRGPGTQSSAQRQKTSATSTRSWGTALGLSLPTASASGTSTMRPACRATIWPKAPSWTASMAAMPKRVASTRSKAVGVPPRCTWPRIVTLDSNPVRCSIFSARRFEIPPRRS